jgi:hypothetical protein
MKSILGFFGFPPPEERDSVRFYLAKNLPYNVRVTLTLILLVAGFGLQILYMNFLYGIPFLIAGMGLILVKGYDSRVRIKGFDIDPQWKTVSIAKIQEIEQLRKRSKKWDRDALDISNPLGCFSLVFFLGVVFFVAIGLGNWAEDGSITVILIIDTIIVIVPLWLSGMKFILKQPNLAIRVKIILELHEVFESLKQKGEEFRPALKLARSKDDKTIPVDARFTVAFPDSPEGFYGLQAQINLNVVQGSSFPYFYCVLAAKPGFGMSPYREKIKLGDDIICEYQRDIRAEVLVIRQRTTKKSGYHTKDRQCEEILEVALEGGRMICQSIKSSQ